MVNRDAYNELNLNKKSQETNRKPSPLSSYTSISRELDYANQSPFSSNSFSPTELKARTSATFDVRSASTSPINASDFHKYSHDPFQRLFKAKGNASFSKTKSFPSSVTYSPSEETFPLTSGMNKSVHEYPFTLSESAISSSHKSSIPERRNFDSSVSVSNPLLHWNNVDTLLRDGSLENVNNSRQDQFLPYKTFSSTISNSDFLHRESSFSSLIDEESKLASLRNLNINDRPPLPVLKNSERNLLHRQLLSNHPFFSQNNVSLSTNSKNYSTDFTKIQSDSSLLQNRQQNHRIETDQLSHFPDHLDPSRIPSPYQPSSLQPLESRKLHSKVDVHSKKLNALSQLNPILRSENVLQNDNHHSSLSMDNDPTNVSTKNRNNQTVGEHPYVDDNKKKKKGPAKPKEKANLGKTVNSFFGSHSTSNYSKVPLSAKLTGEKSDDLSNLLKNKGKKKSQDNQIPHLVGFLGHLSTICKDQYGCRYLQKLLDENPKVNASLFFPEIRQSVVQLMIDPFGNYMCQKLFVYASREQKLSMLNGIGEGIVDICSNLYGTRSMQNIIDKLTSNEQISLLLKIIIPSLTTLACDNNGTHVLQKCIAKFPPEKLEPLFLSMEENLITLATNRHGCCILQRCLDRTNGDIQERLVNSIIKSCLLLVQNAYGNYLVQHVLELNIQPYTERIIEKFFGNICKLSLQKFSSNAIEQCIRTASPSTREQMLQEFLSFPNIEQLLDDCYANYVMQRFLNVADESQKFLILRSISHVIPKIQNTRHGRHILAKLTSSTSS